MTTSKDPRAKSWGLGPWLDEPDSADWAHAGLACHVARHDSFGHLCGYVAVPKGHPAHRKGCDDVPVDVHGSLTYANPHRPYGKSDGRWWLGFDCAHLGDRAPGMRSYQGHDVYRDLAYVTAETNRLAEQLAALAAPTPEGGRDVVLDMG